MPSANMDGGLGNGLLLAAQPNTPAKCLFSTVSGRFAWRHAADMYFGNAQHGMVAAANRRRVVGRQEDYRLPPATVAAANETKSGFCICSFFFFLHLAACCASLFSPHRIRTFYAEHPGTLAGK